MSERGKWVLTRIDIAEKYLQYILFSFKGIHFTAFSLTQVFDGNTDADTVVSHDLVPPIRARYVRFLPGGWHIHISMRVDLYGCEGILQRSKFRCSLKSTVIIFVEKYSHKVKMDGNQPSTIA